MHSPLQAIIRSRATPWVLLVMTLAATAFPMVHPRPAPFVSPALAELSARIRDRGREYVDGLALVVSGDPIMGGNLIASATDRMTVLAADCARTEGCDAETLASALRGAIDERSIAVHGASEVATSMPPTEANEGVDPAAAIPLNGPVKRALNDWLTWNRPQLADAYENYLFLRDQIAPIYEKAGLPEALLFGLMAQETGAKVHSYSSAGAAGPLQFMPATARRYGLERISGFDMRLDPVASTQASAVYLISQLAMFGNDLPLALAAYNGGENRLAALHRHLHASSFWDPKLSDALPMETRSYVPAVLAAMWIFVHADECGLASPRLEVGTTTITLKEPVSIGELSICLGPSQNRRGWFRTLRNLNPRLSGNERIDAGEKLHLPSMLVPKYVAQCAGESPLLARARELQDAGDEKPSRLADALQEGGT